MYEHLTQIRKSAIDKITLTADQWRTTLARADVETDKN